MAVTLDPPSPEDAKLPRFVALVVSYNDPGALSICLDSVRSALPSAGGVVVFDNSTTHATREQVEANLPEGVLYRTVQANVGYAGAAAAALPELFEAGAEHVVILNQDLEVAPDAFDHMIHAADAAPDVGVVGAVTIRRDDRTRVHSAGCAMRGPVFHLSRRESPDDPTITYAEGDAFLVTRRAFETVGNFDPGYFIYFEEADYCHRVRQHGLRVVVSKARVFHDVVPGVHTARWMTRNRIRFFRKHGQPHHLPLFIAYLVGFTVPGLLWVHRKHPVSAFLHVVEGIRWNLKDARARGWWIGLPGKTPVPTPDGVDER